MQSMRNMTCRKAELLPWSQGLPSHSWLLCWDTCVQCIIYIQFSKSVTEVSRITLQCTASIVIELWRLTNRSMCTLIGKYMHNYRSMCTTHFSHRAIQLLQLNLILPSIDTLLWRASYMYIHVYTPLHFYTHTFMHTARQR